MLLLMARRHRPAPTKESPSQCCGLQQPTKRVSYPLFRKTGGFVRISEHTKLLLNAHPIHTLRAAADAQNTISSSVLRLTDNRHCCKQENEGPGRSPSTPRPPETVAPQCLKPGCINDRMLFHQHASSLNPNGPYSQPITPCSQKAHLTAHCSQPTKQRACRQSPWCMSNPEWASHHVHNELSTCSLKRVLYSHSSAIRPCFHLLSQPLLCSTSTKPTPAPLSQSSYK